MTRAIWILVFLLWPVVTMAGGQGFALMAGLSALMLAASVRPPIRFQPYMLALAGVIVFASASLAWSPNQVVVVEFDPANGKYAVKLEVLRFALVVLAGGLLIAAAQKTRPEQAGTALITARLALLLQLAIVLFAALLWDAAFSIVAPLTGSEAEGIQNFTRNGLVLGAALGVLMTAGNPVVAILVVAAAGIAFFAGEIEGGLAAIVASLACLAAVKLMPKHGFRLIGAGLATVVLTAPFTFGALGVHFAKAAPATSMEWRLAIWARVSQVIAENPFIGGGLGVLRTIDETFASGPLAGEKVIPNHAHNMLLQLWAETGLAGAALVSAAIILAAWRLPAPSSLGRAGFLAASLIGGMATVCIVSFDLWNEWWWSACGLMAALGVLSFRAQQVVRAQVSEEDRGLRAL